ncbi:MAG TPA: thiamine pyrophosphate-dependent dehydrogenase E1 component subunit alpha [Elusimicrobiota bacterium]|nr:thiamine pyrophosphate-dependent dehydrogenase E1 component subunit alpha [Elusimicrobiota bacterium]
MKGRRETIVFISVSPNPPKSQTSAPRAHPVHPPATPPVRVRSLSTPLLWRFYESLLRIRLSEQRISRLYPTDKIQSPIHLSTGQEAVSVGVCQALRKGDHVYGTYRGHGLYLALGGGLKGFFAEMFAKTHGCSHGKGGSMHLVAPEVGLMGCSAIVASMIPVATGDALAASIQGSSRVIVAFFGDGAVDAGVFYESVNFALLKKLPILFVLENNGYAVHSKVAERHSRTDLHRVLAGVGLRGRRLEGNDVRQVYGAAQEALRSVRQGAGPLLLELTTYRWQEHVGPQSDIDGSYRRPGEKARALRRDPLGICRHALLERGATSRRLDALCARTESEIDRAVAFAEKSPFPGVGQLLRGVYR